MAVELATGYVSIVPSARGLGRSLARDLHGPLNTAGANAGDTASSAFGSRFAAGMGAAAKKAAVALSVGLGAAAGFGVKVAADFQQTTIAFEGILGSADKAKEVLGDLRKFAAKTPFEFTGLTDSAKQLLAVGFSAEDIIPTMTTLGNVAATLGVGENEIKGVVRALGQMKGKGKASAEELQQISEQIPGFSAIQAIAEDMGISTAEAFEKLADGAIPADAAIESILNGMEKFPGAAGAMDRQSRTLNGVLSTFKDTLSGIAIDFITPALPTISRGVEAFSGFIQNDVMPGLKDFITFFRNDFDEEPRNKVEQFGLVAGEIFRGIGDVLTNHLLPTIQGFVTDGLENLSAWWDRNGDNVKGFFENLGIILRDTVAPAIESTGTFLKDTLLPPLIDFGDWFINKGPAAEVAIAAIAAALTAYAASAVAAALASLAAAWPIAAFALVVGTLTWATQELIDRFDLWPKFANVAQFFIDLAVDAAEAAAAIWDIVEGIEALLEKVPGGSDGGGLLGDILRGAIPGLNIPWLAHGGHLRAGQPAVVGDGGVPELFIPDTAGTVLPEVPSGFGGPLVGSLQVLQVPGEDSVTTAFRELNRVKLLAGAP